MFPIMLALSSLYRTIKYILIPLVFAMAGTPFFWALIQRYRLKAHASKTGWQYIPPSLSSETAVMKKQINGYDVEIWPNDSFGAKVFVYFRSRRKLDLNPGRPSCRPRKIQDFKTPSTNFNAMFHTMRAGNTEIQALQNNPDALDAIVRYRSRWMFDGGDLLMTESYLLMYMTYGTPLAYYLPPRVLEALSLESVDAVTRFEAAFRPVGAVNRR